MTYDQSLNVEGNRVLAVEGEFVLESPALVQQWRIDRGVSRRRSKNRSDRRQLGLQPPGQKMSNYGVDPDPDSWCHLVVQ